MKFATFGRIAVTALLIAAPLGVASAADMPVKAPAPPPPPAFNWNGFYVGAYAGAAWMDQANTTDPCLSPLLGACTAAGIGTYNVLPPAALRHGPSFVGGGTVGYNWQPTPFTLLGLENDIGYIHLKGSILMNPPPVGLDDTVATTKIGDWYDAFTARIGAVDGHAMFYVKGGGVWTKYTTGVVDTGPAGVTINTTTSKTSDWLGCGRRYRIRHRHALEREAEYMVLGVARNIPVAARWRWESCYWWHLCCSVTHTPDVQMIDTWTELPLPLIG